MRRHLATFAAATALALALSASPVLAAGSPLTHLTYSATWLGTVCGYTFTSGEVTEVFRDSSVASHLTFQNVRATNTADESFRVVGSETYNELLGHLTLKVMFVSQGGGIADSYNVVARSYPDGPGPVHFGFDRGTCHLQG